MHSGQVAGYVAIACAIVGLFALGWYLRDVLLLIFGAILAATILRTLATPFITYGRLKPVPAIAAVVVSLVLLFAGVSWLFGQQLASELKGLDERLPRAVKEVQERINRTPAGKLLLEKASHQPEGGENWMQNAGKVLSVSATSIGHMVLVFIAGIYLAVAPARYLDGLVRLFPPRRRRRIKHALIDSGVALRRWLLGQMVSMGSIGTLTGVGLWIAGAPLALVLGILAGLLAFVPVIGPLLVFVPGVLVAFTEGSRTALYAAIVFIVVQQLEGHLITPLAQRWASNLPPAFGLFAVLSFALLFGFPGIFFGIPLAIVTMRLVEMLYIHDELEDAAPAT